MRTFLFFVAFFGVMGCAHSAYRDRDQVDLIDLASSDPSIPLEIRYAGDHNFVGRKIAGYLAPKCFLTRPAAEAVKAVQAELRPMGLSLKVYDCYRPQKAVNDFVRWAKDLNDTRMKAEFYPSVDKRNLFSEGYIAEKSGHSRGSTVDLTLVRVPSSAQRASVTSEILDMGTGYDFFDPASHTLNPATEAAAMKNRMILLRLMEKHGFKNLETEWWHYTLRDEPNRNQYFDFDVK